jgi:ATP:cob(I)alamin adenosyltransferase
MKIYTKTGDNGKTSLCDGSRLPKDDMRIEAYGTLDELNANIGLLIAMLQSDTPKESPAHDNKLTERLEEIQAELFVIGTELAYTECKVKTIVSTKEMINKIEGDIDLMASQLPTHHHFILPGGTLSAAQSHVCRTVCRRAERRIVTLSQMTKYPAEILEFVNRLSDYLFILSRYLNNNSRTGEKTWENTCR